MNCRLCDSTELKYFYAAGYKDRYRYYRCTHCGLVNLDLEGLDILGNQEKYFRRFVPPGDYENEKGALQAYSFIKRYVRVRGSYLDIGCGNGAVLYFARKDGWKVRGLEISPGYAKHVKEHLGIEVDVADFLEFEDPRQKYELVSLRHVLEHIPDSVKALRKIAGFLKPRGYAHFEFPNINGIALRFKRFLSRYGIHKIKWDPDFRPGHCNEFSRKSFLYLIRETGFNLIRWETYSFKPFKNTIYNRIHQGAKARAIIQKVESLV